MMPSLKRSIFVLSFAVAMTAVVFVANAQDAPPAATPPATTQTTTTTTTTTAAPTGTAAELPAATPLAPAGTVPTGAAPAPAADGNYSALRAIPRAAIMEDGSVKVNDELFFQSLLFTPEELTAIVTVLSRAKRGSGKPKADAPAPTIDPVTGMLVPPAEEEEVKPYYPPIPTKRTITVSGVLYRKPGDWIVWINGYKLVPGQRIPELVDMQVERDRVHIKWFDIGMAKVIALTMRPNETYDITSGVMLSGERAQ